MTAMPGKAFFERHPIKFSERFFISLRLKNRRSMPEHRSQKKEYKMSRLVRNTALTMLLTVACQGAFAAGESDDFVEDASAKGVAEVEAGKLAQEKGTAADVKTFADMMIKDHTAANAQLKSLAQAKKLEVSDDAMLLDKAKAMILDLRSAKSFDQAYANNQVKAHETTIELFEEEAKDGKDPELKAFATEMLPKLKTHLEHAKKLAAAHGGDAAKQ
jgi:putative membrane protein